MAGFDEDIDIDNSGDKTLQQVLQKSAMQWKTARDRFLKSLKVPSVR